LDANILFSAIGLYLLYLRLSNREALSFRLFAARRIVGNDSTAERIGCQASADVCAVTRRPFVTGEYFYTLLFHDAGGYRVKTERRSVAKSERKYSAIFIWKSR